MDAATMVGTIEDGPHVSATNDTPVNKALFVVARSAAMLDKTSISFGPMAKNFTKMVPRTAPYGFALYAIVSISITILHIRKVKASRYYQIKCKHP
jgi:hypothetical protein